MSNNRLDSVPPSDREIDVSPTPISTLMTKLIRDLPVPVSDLGSLKRIEQPTVQTALTIVQDSLSTNEMAMAMSVVGTKTPAAKISLGKSIDFT